MAAEGKDAGKDSVEGDHSPAAPGRLPSRTPERRGLGSIAVAVVLVALGALAASAALFASKDLCDPAGPPTSSPLLLMLPAAIRGGLVALPCWLRRAAWPRRAALATERPSSPPSRGVDLNADSPILGNLAVYASGFCIKKDSSPADSHPCGEDAFHAVPSSFVRPGHVFLAVADGVGGWSQSGGDSSKVSNGIIQGIAKALASPLAGPQSPEEDSPGGMLQRAAIEAFAAMRQAGSFSKGSTTLSTVLVDVEANRADFANLGDSGALIIRRGEVIASSASGQEAFNMPHQVGFDQNGTPYGSIEAMTSKMSIRLLPRDIIVVATDGVLDNLYPEEIAALVTTLTAGIWDPRHSSRPSPMSSKRAAFEERIKGATESLARLAYIRSKEALWKSPFASGAIANGYTFSGGHAHPAQSRTRTAY